MFEIIKPDSKYDFMSKTALLSKVSIGAFIVSLILILMPADKLGGIGLKFGLDFSGGHEVLVAFDPAENPDITEIRSAVAGLNLGDANVQSFEIPDTKETHFLVKVQRSETFGEKELSDLTNAFTQKYGPAFKAPLNYNPEAGDVIEVEFNHTSTVGVGAVDTSSAAMIAVVQQTDHKVRLVRKIGRPDQNRYAIVLMGIDVSVIDVLREKVGKSAVAQRVEFVGPTVGRQLRNDGILAMFYALLWILIYIALRFDFFYGPGAIVCLFHDAVITIGILAIIGHEFSLATVAGLLTLIGYSINDTIVVFDRIRERIGKASGSGLRDVLNRAINETLGRTLMTSITTGFACVCLMWFGRKTVLADFGLIMGIGVLIGTYSSIFVASPVFWSLRARFGQKQIIGAGAKTAGKASPKKAVSAS